MKHIKKKTINHLELNEEFKKKAKSVEGTGGNIGNINPKDVKNMQALMLMENGTVLRSFFYNNNGVTCIIPLANPVLIYFHTAQTYLRAIELQKKKLLDSFTPDKNHDENSMTLFYDFFGMTSSFVILLHTAIEAFINQKIPESFKYEKNDGKCTRVYSHDQVQRHIPLDEKIAKVLNVLTGKNFDKQYSQKKQHLQNLKDLRDSIVHTKNIRNMIDYDELFKRTLNFRFQESIEAVRDFINYHEPELIEPCPCNADF